MKVITGIDALRSAVAEPGFRRDGLGLVPTMGNIHAGHLQLVQRALEHTRTVAVSLFVNPTQFDDPDDFQHYPRSLEADLDQLRDARTGLVFVPQAGEMYPHGITVPEVVVEPTRLSGELEGAHRPGHFRGVATVVTKLLNLFRPDVAVFGRKDYQQLRIIQALVRELFVGTRIVAAPTVREPDGLAMSSRNSRLSAEHRALAPRLYQCLRDIAQAVRGGVRDLAGLESDGRRQLQSDGFDVDYVTVRRPDLGVPVDDTDGFVVLAAASLGGTRLIDNIASEDLSGGDTGA